jgi:hypothetical protein
MAQAAGRVEEAARTHTDASRKIAGCVRVVVVGEAAQTIDWSALGPDVLIAIQPPHDFPRATAVGRIAALRSCVGANALEPVYVRPAQITAPKGVTT